MCFQTERVKERSFHLFGEQIYVVQLNVVVLEPLIQSDFSLRKLILKLNDFILCIAFSILIFLHINGVLLDSVIICEKCWWRITYNF